MESHETKMFLYSKRNRQEWVDSSQNGGKSLPAFIRQSISVLDIQRMGGGMDTQNSENKWSN